MYLLYDCFNKPNSFVTASAAVLKTLDVPYQVLDNGEQFKYHGGYYGRIGKIEPFVFANVYNIALAAKRGALLLALEEDSYANLICAISLIYNNQAISDFISKEIHSQNIQVDIFTLHKHIAYFPTLIGKMPNDLEQHIQLHFAPSYVLNPSLNLNDTSRNIYSLSHSHALPLISAKQNIRGNDISTFSACLYYSNRHFDCSLNHEYDNLGKIFNCLKLQAFETPFSLESYTHLLKTNEEIAYQKSGEILYAGIDLGVDFMCVFSDSVRNIFDTHFKLCTKHCKRDKIAIPILHLAQILLLSFNKPQEAAFELHHIKPNFILENPKAS